MLYCCFAKYVLELAQHEMSSGTIWYQPFGKHRQALVLSATGTAWRCPG